MQPVESLTSSDGGLTRSNVDDLYWDVRAKSTETPSGRYVIQDQGIVRIGSEGGSKMAYSTVYFQQHMVARKFPNGRQQIRYDLKRIADGARVELVYTGSEGKTQTREVITNRWRGTWPNSPAG